MADLVVWRKPPPLISKALFNKATKLTLKETLWVWDDVVALIISVALTVLSILWLVYPYTMQGWATLMLVGALLMFATALALFLIRVNGERDPLKFNYTKGAQLTHSGRKQLCLLDRNRKRAPGWERSWRMPDIDHSQYSVWITPGISQDEVYNKLESSYERQYGLRFRVIEHRPKQYGWGPRVALVCEQTRYVKPGDEDGTTPAQAMAMTAELFKANPTFEESCEVQSQLEEIAEFLEGYGYEKRVKVHEMERMALQLRR